MKLGNGRPRRPLLALVMAAAAVLVGACAAVVPPVTVHEWKSRAIPESQGIVSEVGGKKIQRRYPFGGFGTLSFHDWPTFAGGTYFPPRKGQMPAGIKGDPKKGHALVTAPGMGPCTACHVVPDPKVATQGNVGPDLRAIGARGIPDEFLFQIIYDPRVFYGVDSPMPPFGASGLWTPEQIVHAVAYLQSLVGKPPGTPEKVTDDPHWDPATRVLRPVDYGDAFDPTVNPGLAIAESVAVPMWSQVGPRGQSCASCHGPLGAPEGRQTIGTIKSMAGVAVRYPKWSAQHRRMMAIEDFLSVHAPETTGIELPTQGTANMSMSILIKMQSYGMPYAIDLKNPNVQAAVKRGQELFHRRIGQRGHACADCHSARGGGNKWLAGRFLAHADKDAMVNHPYFRTAWQQLIDFRIRVQWCGTPLQTNMIPGDAPELADLETFLVAGQTQRGDRMQVPRLAH